MFKGYKAGSFFDEMYGFDQPECLNTTNFESRFERMSETESTRNRTLENGFLEQGITFTVYGDDEGMSGFFLSI